MADEARDKAYAEGRLAERIEGRLNSHEDRLNALNGSLEKAASESRQLRASVEVLNTKIDALAADQERKQAVDAALKEEVMDANAQQVSNRMFVLGVLAIIATILVGALAQTHVFL